MTTSRGLRFFILTILSESLALKIYKFHTQTVPEGAFRQAVEKIGWNFVKCVSTCKNNVGCNALQVDSLSCRMGWLDVGHVNENGDEHAIKVFADQDYLCTYKMRSLSEMAQIVVNGKSFYLVTTPTTSEENQDYCRARGAEEVMLKNKMEFEAFNKLIGSKEAHIGLYYNGNMTNCRNEECLDKLKWADGSAFHWSRNIYHDLVINTGDPCMRINPSGEAFEMQDNECHRKFFIACQIQC